MASDDDGNPSAPQRRRPGRPKGSKNGPNAKNVGRPRKDGQPPKQRQFGHRTASLGENSSLQPEAISQDLTSQLSDSQPTQHSETEAAPSRGAPSLVPTPRVSEPPECTQQAVPPPTLSSQPHGDPLQEQIYRPGDGQFEVAGMGEGPNRSELGEVRALSLLPPASLDLTGLGGSMRDIDELEYVGRTTSKAGEPATAHSLLLPGGRSVEAVSAAVEDVIGLGSGDGSGTDIFGSEGWQGFDDEDWDEDEDVDHILGSGGEGVNTEQDEFNPIPDDDESEEPVPQADGDGGAQPRTARSAMPTWLLQDYADMREKLQAQIRRNPSKRPTCYDHGTFLDGSPYAFFTADRKHQPEPRDFYSPGYFVWLPHLLGPRIPCANCAAAGRRQGDGSPILLRSHGFPKAPRRIVDVDHCIYVIGYRYRCAHAQCKKTFSSWSPGVLTALPRALACQFDFHLTYRGGLTDRVVALMRSCFLHGMGPTPFANLIRTHHIRRYEKLHEQYLEAVLARLQTPFTAYLTKFQPFGLFDDRNGYAGFTPSPNYFRQFYIQYIDSHVPEMDQYSAMLSGKLLVVDHSHKVPKHLGKVNGVPVFTALHSCTNEYMEIRSMVLTPTKAHNQFMPALGAISRLLKMYGHDPVELAFTDNVRGDKAALEEVIPSLREGVTPVKDFTTLPKLSVPSDEWNAVLLSSVYQINTRFNTIMADLAADAKLYVSLDMEWSVDTASGLRGRVAVISVAYDGVILLVWLRCCLRNGCLNLPTGLLAFLRAPSVIKVGVKITADFKHLFASCDFREGVDDPFRGAVNLGALAKAHNPSIKATISLADLVAVYVRHHLPKDEAIRVSTDWDNDEMSHAQQEYAALDAYAGWAVFQALGQRESGGPVTATTPGATPVTLMSSDRSTAVAQGHIALDRPSKHDGINVSPKRVLIVVTSVLVPGHLVPKELLSSGKDTPFSEFPAPPFKLLCKERHLRTRAANEAVTRPISPPTPASSAETVYLDPSTLPAAEPDTENEPDYLERDTDWDLMTEDPGAKDQAVESSDRDPSATVKAAALDPDGLSDAWESLSTRVLGDVFHLMHEFKISVHHGLRRPFARALRDALFIPDPDDKVIIERFLEERQTTWDAMLLYHPCWLFRRVKRIVPPPEILLPRVRDVLQKFGPLKDSTTGQPLFNDKAWDICTNVLENIRRGYYSDPPGIQLYFTRGQDKYGLMQYKCCRGTNAVEGGVHQNVIRWFGSFNAAPEFALQLLRDYRLYHNLRVGTLNRTGTPYTGSYDVWTRNRISLLLDTTSSRFESLPRSFGPGGWVNGNLYAPSMEVFGILPMPDSKRLESGMMPYHHRYAMEQKIRHRQLAFRQNCRVAILPVHTRSERALFRLLITDIHSRFGNEKEPSWDAVAAEWSRHVDGTAVFYKLKEHLKNYWKMWGENVNEKKSIQINQGSYQEIQARLRADRPKLPKRDAAQPTTLSSQVSTAPSRTLDSSEDELNEWEISRLLGAHHLNRSAVHFEYGDQGLPPPPPPRGSDIPQSPPRDKGKKRAWADTAIAAPPQGIRVQKRKKRACRRCSKTNCKGRFKGRDCAPDTDDDEAGSTMTAGYSTGGASLVAGAQVAANASSPAHTTVRSIRDMLIGIRAVSNGAHMMNAEDASGSAGEVMAARATTGASDGNAIQYIATTEGGVEEDTNASAGPSTAA
ncbi:hypothetical protein OE88DRAFT_1804266 [Heliocybe sulcata]|uniref:3'-5' exonuclease n=1 Tax=Heliocybe sulcata TaxID=5364 RepID=A0A5C3NET4_9AGAM|nr:hypothetical protein OE88DRAFT_1804266 [Heliocybe sulcata]